MTWQSHFCEYIWRKWKHLAQKDTYTPMFIAALFAITRHGELIKKLVYIYKIAEYYFIAYFSAIK